MQLPNAKFGHLECNDAEYFKPSPKFSEGNADISNRKVLKLIIPSINSRLVFLPHPSLGWETELSPSVINIGAPLSMSASPTGADLLRDADLRVGETVISEANMERPHYFGRPVLISSDYTWHRRGVGGVGEYHRFLGWGEDGGHPFVWV